MIRTYSLHLTSHVQIINLPQTLNHINEMKITLIKYKTAALNQKVMHVVVNNFDNCLCLKPDNTTFKYTKMIILPQTVNEEINYESNFYDIFVNQYNTTNINSFTIQIYIDYEPAINLVTASNPLILELRTR